MKRNSILLIMIGMALALSAHADVYRWTDENGKVHFGRTLPPEYANKPHEILNEQGQVIKRITDPLAEQKAAAAENAPGDEDSDELEPLFTDQEVRVRSDSLLMLRYHTEEDLMQAMQVEIDQLGYDVRLINQTNASVVNTITAQIRNAANRQRAGLPADENLEKEIRTLRQRLRRSDSELSKLKTREEEIRQKFDMDLKRYRYLANGGTPGAIIEEDEG